jgi:hypothetical protein
VLTVISPVLVGQKWTRIFLNLNKEQLPLQTCYNNNPHVEVTDIKSSVASSDEERLAAGVSMIGLQTKRLSRAQRKTLTGERKMKDGTWTEKKPPRKTPSSEEKGAVGV